MIFDLDLFSNHLYLGKRILRRFAKKYCPNLSGEVLDIGCGKRPYQRFTNARQYVGMDSREEVNPDVIGVVEKIPFPNESFDGVLCTEVLEHIKEPEKGVREINRVLKKEGMLYLTVPMSWCLHYEPDDFYRFTKWGIRHLLEKNGFKILNLERYGGFFSLIFIRLIDVLFFLILRGLIFLPNNFKRYLGLTILLPISFFGFYLSLIADKIDKRDALGWVALAEKEHRV